MEGWVEIAEQRLGTFQVANRGWQRLCYRLPAAGLDAVVPGRIGTERPWSPARVGLGPDTRQLGIAVRRLWAE